MSSDTILKDDAGNTYSLDNLSTQRWLEGQGSGEEACLVWLMDRAVALFRDGKYEQAKYIREIAIEMDKELAPKLRERSEQHKREFPWRLTTVG